MILNPFWSRVLRSALLPAVNTTLTVAARGKADQGNSIAPLNAVSHILWGDEASSVDQPTLKHTLPGTVLNAAAMLCWAGVYEGLFGKAARRGDTATALAGGAATAGLAYITDYYLVPKRFTPGFEKELTPKSMLAVYAALAISLPLASMLEARDASNGTGL